MTMTLSDVLTAMANNTGVNITLVDEDGNSLITFGAPGYASIESDLGSRIVKRIRVASQKEVVITIENAAP